MNIHIFSNARKLIGRLTVFGFVLTGCAVQSNPVIVSLNDVSVTLKDSGFAEKSESIAKSKKLAHEICGKADKDAVLLSSYTESTDSYAINRFNLFRCS
jgi:hypothetical protein